jgi:predicted Zn finger-like uncharacterized protein
MFTCCPQCATVFRVTANQLRVARGDVRCGNCAHVFNAMEYLADELPDARVDTEGDDPRASQADDRSAREVDQDSGPARDPLEFDAPEQAWSEIFIRAPAQGGDISLDGELETITADPEEWRAMLAELGVEPGDIVPEDQAETDFAVATTSLTAEENASESPAADRPWSSAFETFYVAPETAPETVFVNDDDALAGARNEPTPADAVVSPAPVAVVGTDALPADPAAVWSATETAEEAAWPDEDVNGEPPPWSGLEAEDQAPPARRSYLGWAAALLLMLTLAAQLTHHYRDTLATHPRYGGLVRELYGRLGLTLYPAWPLAAFHIRRSEAMAGGSAPNALDINAAVEVTGGQPVGLPLVRVTLRDQWSNTVGSRVFLPDEYLVGELPGIVAPGTRIPVALSLADPGPEARGYEVDLCLQRRWAGLECQLAERPQRP